MTAERLACLLLGEKIGASVQRIVQAGTDYDEAIYATTTSWHLAFFEPANNVRLGVAIRGIARPRFLCAKIKAIDLHWLLFARRRSQTDLGTATKSGASTASFCRLTGSA